MSKYGVLASKGGFLTDTYLKSGTIGCVRKIWAALKMQLPSILAVRRTNASVGAYFDLITDDARMFYGDSFHFGYFKNGDESFEEALSNHTDAVAALAGVNNGKLVLDVGCGICAPAIRIAGRHDCHISGINISAEQVRQGKTLVKDSGLANRITVTRGNALDLDFEDATFDSILCIEVAGDICVTDAQKNKLAREMYRVLKPGGHVGFSDLIFTASPTREEERSIRTVLYHEGSELITDWPSIFRRRGFEISEEKNIIKETMQTWKHSLQIYKTRAQEVEKRYGKTIARRTMNHLERIPSIIEKYGSFLLMSAVKPA